MNTNTRGINLQIIRVIIKIFIRIQIVPHPVSCPDGMPLAYPPTQTATN